MKSFRFMTLALALFAWAACTPEEKPGTGNGSNNENSGMKIENLAFGSETLTPPGAITFTLDIDGGGVELSTLEVSAVLGDKEIATKSIRTTGSTAQVEESIDIPFTAGMADGAVVAVNFEAINIDGASVKQTKTVKITRPELPDVLYMVVGDNTYQMTKSAETPTLYTTEKVGFESTLTATIYSSEDMENAEFIWGASEVANQAALIAFGGEGVSVSYPAMIVENLTFDAVTFMVGAEGVTLNIAVNGTALAPDGGLLYSKVSFTKDAEVAITGIEDIENAWNRDFFSYEGGKFIFLRESGEYDVYYSPKYNYIYIAKMDAVAPECLWIMGHGFSSAPVWHDDFYYGGWTDAEIARVGYAVKTGDNLYQCSLYLSSLHEWGSFEFEVYSDRLAWTKDNGFAGTSITGFNKSIKLSPASDGMPGLVSDTGFQPGYYTIVFNNATGEINLTRHTEWVDNGGSGIVINGTELLSDPSYFYENIYFENGAAVSFSGLKEEEIHRDFFRKEGNGYVFAGVSGTYLVQYYPDYEYMWLSNAEMTYPDCIYILGSGKWASPVYDADKYGLWDDVAYVRSAPYFCVAPKIAENTYQATMSMATDNMNWRVLLEFYSDLYWGSVPELAPIEVTGPNAARFYIESTYFCGVDEKEDPFEKGNYRFTITTSAAGASINVEKID